MGFSIFRKLLVGAAIVVSTCASGFTPAHAAAFVLSDQVKWTGTATPGSSAGTYNFSSKQCKLTSDGETPVFPCQVNGQVATSATGAITGTAVVQSADGTTTFSFTLTPPAAGGNTYNLKGTGKEADAPDPGQPAVSYPCKVKGTVTAVPQPNGTLALTSVFKVLEKNTAP